MASKQQEPTVPDEKRIHKEGFWVAITTQTLGGKTDTSFTTCQVNSKLNCVGHTGQLRN